MDKDQDDFRDAVEDEALAPEAEAAPPPPQPEGPSPEQQIAELKDRVLRAMAETENVRKRAERERDDMAKYAVTNFAREVVSVADNLRRALESGTKPGESDAAHLKSLLEGVEATQRGLFGVLEKFGIRVVDPLGQKFDPNLHQALFETEDATKDPGTVTQVIQQGFVIADRLLRPALVAVAKGAPKQAPDIKA